MQEHMNWGEDEQAFSSNKIFAKEQSKMENASFILLIIQLVNK
jgi:hypothetical protein